MTNYGASDFVGILFTIALFAYLTNLAQWGLFQILANFFEKEHENIFHHHFHYKAQ
jgi:hypothetical protein